MKNNKTKILAVILLIAMIAALAMSLYSCEKADENTLGKGKTTFKLDITDDKGVTTAYTIKTNEKTVAAALQHKDVKLIASDNTVDNFNTVNGMKADWEADSAYWAFFIEGEWAMDSAFNTDVVEGANYAFKYEQWLDDDGSWDK